MLRFFHGKLLTMLVILSFGAGLRSSAQNLAVSGILNPVTTTCAPLPYSDKIRVRIFNGGPSAVSSFDISYNVDGGPTFTETVSTAIANGASYDYTFVAPTVITTGGVHVIKVFTSYPTDPSSANDTMSVKLVNKISTFPYCESFENNDGGWVAAGTNSTWVWGTPAKTYLNRAGDGTKAWMNGGLNGYYANSDLSYITSPCFDLSSLTAPQLSFKFWIEVELNYENVTMEYSVAGGPWYVLGTANEPDGCNTQGWFNNGANWSGNVRSYPCSFGWGLGCASGRCGNWVNARHCLDVVKGQTDVRFRFRFSSSGTQCTAEGFAFDSICIGEAVAPVINFSANTACAYEPTIFANLSEACVTNVKWDFGDGSAVLASNAPVHVYNRGGTFDVKMIATSRCSRVDTFTKSITVLPPPASSVDTGNGAGQLKKRYCYTDGPVTLSGTPAGGRFTVNGANATTFDPSTIGVGNHTVVYIYKDVAGNGCTNYDTVKVLVYQPNVSIDSLLGSYCQTSPARKLRGTPAGGIFEINGVQDSIFDAATLGLGSHVITYTYTDADGCVGSETRVVDIVNNLLVDITALDSVYCKQAADYTPLANPVGGKFYVDGVLITDITPSTLDTGYHMLVYSFSDGSGCSAADSARFYIDGPEASILNLDSVYCGKDTVINLSGSPLGGTFFVDGTAAGSFNPRLLSTGYHNISYVIVSANGCTDTARQSVLIDKPVVKIINMLPNYCINGDSVELTGTPVGGDFYIGGVKKTYFDPAKAGLGFHKIYYYHTNSHGCSSRDSFTVEVMPLPQPQFVGLDTVYCINISAVTLAANPSGGAFSIDGVPATALDPSSLNPNVKHTIEYIYIDQDYGCISTISKEIAIVLPPNLSISGVAQSFCLNDAAVTPAGSPVGGKFVLDGDTVTQVDPSKLTPGQYSLDYIYSSIAGCTSKVSHLFEVLPAVSGTISPRVDTICAGEATQLTFNTTSWGYIWNTGDTTSTVTVSPSSNTKYWVNGRGCQGFGDTVEVIVIPRPVAEFEVTPEAGRAPMKINGSALKPGKTFIWSIDSQQVASGQTFEHTIQKAGTYKLILLVDNGNGCIDTVSREIVVNQTPKLKIPNVFTPGNGDGLNDDFRVYELDQTLTDNFTFEIYNRWGMLVYRSEDVNSGWDGTINGKEAVEGVYYYILFVKYKDRTEGETLSGSVTLIR